MRLIDADELLQTEKLLDTDIIRNSKEANWLYEQMLYDIANAPTIDAQPVVHAYFKDEKIRPEVPTHYTGYCSNCGKFQISEVNYCCQCGAKMDGKEENHD